MKKGYGYVQIYTDIIKYLSHGARCIDEITEHICKSAKLTEAESADSSASGNLCRIRANIGALINHLMAKGAIGRTKDGGYFAKIEAPTALRAQKCEAEILKLLSVRPVSKETIKSKLTTLFGTKKTRTKRDDNLLSVFITDALKNLCDEKLISYNGKTYSIPKEKYATASNKRQLSELKGDFLSLLHSRGGEFFEYYFMNLLSKYLTHIGKLVKKCEVTGGSADGGIDGIAETVDRLGFGEVIMVQTKNRTDYATEIDIRSFYGAVNAKRGTRGIYATTSGFHPMAKKLLDELDDCVGIDGERIFNMAKEVGYGIINDGEKFKIDTSLI